MQVANALMRQQLAMALQTNVDSASLYGSLFEKHEVTKAQFDSTMVYYAARPKELQDIYNKVTTRLKVMEQNQMENMQLPSDSLR